ncbi:CBS domain-containing protein [Methanospirillum purgamenti]|uniref:CBS domain-containing protein n=1 Tax=Methanospirillum hungatei TaxID=2203 RepID=A0A8F5VKX6_METHU|nr:CBS domain-containing protein [Methanospirillum hungatei]QXO93365.1 CBS domain-containing protein [Methanospirillum hungatei]
MNSHHDNGNRTVLSIATSKVISAPPTMRIFGAIETLTQWGFRRLPIVDPGTHRLKGIITARDVIDFLGGGELFNLINVKHDGNFLAAINESVSKIMKTDVRTLHPDASLSEALEIILRDRIGGIPIVDDEGVLNGIITERDVLKILCRSHAATPVEDVMTRSLLVQQPDCPLATVTKVMTEHQFRRLPIVKKDILFGIITATDIVRYIGSGKVFEKLVTGDVAEVMSIPVRDLLSGNLFTTNSEATVTDAARAMMAKKVGALPVIDQSRLVGLVTEFDLVRAFSPNEMSRR